jgi:hypothetical protein
MDQGIIKNFKCFYKTAFIERLLDSFESEEDNESAYRMVNSVSILDSLYWVQSSWAQVTEKTINSFKHAGFHQQFALNSTELDSCTNADKLSSLINQLNIPGLTIEATMAIDENLLTCEFYLHKPIEIIEDEIVIYVLQEIAFNEEQETSDQIEDNEIVKPICSDVEARKLLIELRDYLMVKSPDLVYILVEIQNNLSSRATLTQADIRTFFN